MKTIELIDKYEVRQSTDDYYNPPSYIWIDNTGEIIRCKDCKHHFYDNDGIPYCDNIDYGYGWKDEDYCSKAERKEE